MLLQAKQQPLAESNQTLTWILAASVGMSSPIVTVASDTTNARVKKGLTGLQGTEFVKPGAPLHHKDGTMPQWWQTDKVPTQCSH